MTKTKIKICGITNLDDARYCAAAGADLLGFIQYPKSPRFVAPEAAREIIEWVAGPKPVGVFVNAELQEVDRVSKAAGFKQVQLHGNETPEYCAQIHLPVVKTFRISPDTTADRLRQMMDAYEGVVEYFLLDTYHPGKPGGTGRVFNWNVAAMVAEDYDIFLAGGITPENVVGAIESVRPLGVDVCSGVEAAPGLKDFDKLGAFFERLNEIYQE